MKCPLQTEQTDLLLDEAAGILARRELDAETMAALSVHMESCPDCVAFRRDQKAVWEALDLWQAAPVSVDFNRRLWQRIDAAAAEPLYKRLGYRRLVESLRFANWKPMIPLTAAILAIVAGFLLDHPRAEKPAGVSIIEADQVERTLDDIQLLRQFDVGNAPSGTQTSQKTTM